MNPRDPSEDHLDARIRAAAPLALPDEGFANRVLASLPPAAPETSRWRMWVAASAVAAAAAAVLAGSGLPGLDSTLNDATAALGRAVADPRAILALAAIAIAWSLVSGDEAVE
jgi:hypothetical protein